MDGPQPQICREQIWTHEVRPEGAAQGCAASINHRHADFQNAGGSHKVIFINKLPGRLLHNLHHCA